MSLPLKDEASRISLAELPSSLALAVYSFQFKCLSSGDFPEEIGAAWRGALGRNLRRIVCTTPDLDCAECLFRKRCAYSLCFEPSLSARASGALANQNAAPPFVLFLPHQARKLRTDDAFTLELTLIGKNAHLLPAIVRALENVNVGITSKGTAQLQLQQVGLLTKASIADVQVIWQKGQWFDSPHYTLMQCPSSLFRTKSIGVRFLSPVRIKHKGQIIKKDLSAEIFIVNLLRRLSVLSELWMQQELALDGSQVKHFTKGVINKSQQLQYWAGSRYSAAQQRKIPMSGLLGELILDTHKIHNLLPLLWLGQWLHVGKGCSIGQGRYELFNPENQP
ncbi:MAG: CRISPR system precrRNA processing endoribonuclease RAMP protein Cas6 [Motiliproteus sp.]